ncbi:MAG: hypothetical protein ABI354_00610 [Candidatus Saccharimonadales bacterium]
MTTPYITDFPELIKVPASSYGNTLVLGGMEPIAAAARLMTMDLMVKWSVENAGDKLAYRAPETIDYWDVLDRLAYPPSKTTTLEEHTVSEAVASKVILILRGEMEQNPLWLATDELA